MCDQNGKRHTLTALAYTVGNHMRGNIAASKARAALRQFATGCRDVESVAVFCAANCAGSKSSSRSAATMAAWRYVAGSM